MSNETHATIARPSVLMRILDGPTGNERELPNYDSSVGWWTRAAAEDSIVWQKNITSRYSYRIEAT